MSASVPGVEVLAAHHLFEEVVLGPRAALLQGGDLVLEGLELPALAIEPSYIRFSSAASLRFIDSIWCSSRRDSLVTASEAADLAEARLRLLHLLARGRELLPASSCPRRCSSRSIAVSIAWRSSSRSMPRIGAPG